MPVRRKDNTAELACNAVNTSQTSTFAYKRHVCSARVLGQIRALGLRLRRSLGPEVGLENPRELYDRHGLRLSVVFLRQLHSVQLILLPCSQLLVERPGTGRDRMMERVLWVCVLRSEQFNISSIQSLFVTPASEQVT